MFDCDSKAKKKMGFWLPVPSLEEGVPALPYCSWATVINFTWIFFWTKPQKEICYNDHILHVSLQHETWRRVSVVEDRFKTIEFLTQMVPVLTALFGILTSCKGLSMLTTHVFSLKDLSTFLGISRRGISTHSSTSTMIGLNFPKYYLASFSVK